MASHYTPSGRARSTVKNIRSPATPLQIRGRSNIDEHTLELTSKRSGKVTNSGRVVVSPDGKTRTLRLTATDSSGKKVSGLSMYNKQ